jgi:hypothetical protein
MILQHCCKPAFAIISGKAVTFWVLLAQKHRLL